MKLGMNELIESIGKAVSEAQQNVELHSLYRFFNYFEEEPENDGRDDGGQVLCPKTAKMAVPKSDDMNGTVVSEIPLLSLVPHNQVSLKQVSVKMKVSLYTDDTNEIVADMNVPARNAPSSSEHAGEEGAAASQMHEVELVYQVSEKPEGLSRVVDNITKTI